MCGCNNITIPTGETGAQGPIGLTGATGEPGTNGTNGVNGTTILASYNSLTGVGTPATTVETTLFTTNLPANTLSTNGDELELVCHYLVNSSDVNVPLRVKLGSKILTLFNQGNVSTTAYKILKIKISRISVTSQLWIIEELSVNGAGTKSVNFLQSDSSTVDLSTILAFEISGQNVSATANCLLLKKATLYKYKI